MSPKSSTAVGSKIAPPAFEWLHRRSRSAGTLVARALAFTLGFAELAEAAQLAPIVGCIVAELVTRGAASLPIAPFRLDRFPAAP